MKQRAKNAIDRHKMAIRMDTISRKYAQTSYSWCEWTKSIKAHERAIERIKKNAAK